MKTLILAPPAPLPWPPPCLALAGPDWTVIERARAESVPRNAPRCSRLPAAAATALTPARAG